jgi:hypothetical protein
MSMLVDFDHPSFFSVDSFPWDFPDLKAAPQKSQFNPIMPVPG